jgi:hypothetical protein
MKKGKRQARLRASCRKEKILEVIMKREILKSFTMLMLTIALAAMTVQAQSANQMNANIPFSFTIGNQTLPAGEYTVRYINQDSGKTALLFRSMDGKTSRIVNMNTTQKAESEVKASLVFNQYGNSYFLSEVWTGGDQYGLSLPPSRSERQIKDGDLAKLEAKRVTVALNARR